VFDYVAFEIEYPIGSPTSPPQLLLNSETDRESVKTMPLPGVYLLTVATLCNTATALMQAAMDMFRLNGSLAGEHIHAFTDFVQLGVSGGGGGRVMIEDVAGLNYKGMFSREREPKAAAGLMRARYNQMQAEIDAALEN
jgi:hypothetical protein